MTAVDTVVSDARATDTTVYRPVAATALPFALGGRRRDPAPVRSRTVVPTSTTAPTVTPRVQPSLERRRLWERRYIRRIRATDIALVVSATVLAGLLDMMLTSATTLEIWAVTRVAAVTIAVWLAMLVLFHARSAEVMGSGSTEYKLVAQATCFAFGILAMLFVVFEWSGLRMMLLAALPVGLLVVLAGRWAWRRWLIRQRRYGHYASRVIVAGTDADVEYAIRTLSQDRTLGYIVVGVTTMDPDAQAITVDSRSYPVLGTMGSVSSHARQVGADTIIVATRPDDDPDFIKRLSWDLEGTAAELILTSRLADVAGPRISLRPVDGLPLIHVQIPRFEGGAHSLKRAVDIVVAGSALILVALITPVIALLIALDDRGPIFFRQTRIGRDGREFGILKFRTMRTTAEAELAELATRNEGAGPLFKIKRDPRITRVGAVLRRFSLDELPQFWNVLRGEMSVVGPRPPLPSEVTAYSGTVYRRLYIKPGITGLWQVSGRSDLSWSESVRLDLHYVENWSLMADLMIMWRTARVMVLPKGAY